MWGCVSEAERRNWEEGNKQESVEIIISGNGAGGSGEGVQLRREKVRESGAFCPVGTGFRERKEKLL